MRLRIPHRRSRAVGERFHQAGDQVRDQVGCDERQEQPRPPAHERDDDPDRQPEETDPRGLRQPDEGVVEQAAAAVVHHPPLEPAVEIEQSG